jgi:hypothetical protein
MKKFILLLLIHVGIVASLSAQVNVLGATITSGIEMKLDTLNVTIRRLIKVEQINIQLADSTNKLYKRNLIIATDLNKLTEYNSDLTKKLVTLTKDNILLANENKKISGYIQLHTKQLVNLDSQNIGVQNAIKGLTDQIAKTTNENKESTSKLVLSANKNEISSTIMLWATIFTLLASIVMIVLAFMQMKLMKKAKLPVKPKQNLTRKQYINNTNKTNS